ncbi:MAG: hypothetical protein B6229_09850 [Spirochaetaceae bacterium 4572_7]|nr:MAG: hypothetical protein B6229_09850 [Spirochaetaceae bacterium 4572_7]
MKKNISIFLVACLYLFNAGAQELDLKSYMELVEENSKDLKIAEIDQELAGTQEKLARSAIRPMISGSAGYSRNLMDIKAPQPVGVSGNQFIFKEIDMNKDNEFQFAVGGEQQLFNMSVFKALEASRKYRDMTGSIYEASRQGILTAAKQLYFQVVLLDEVYKVKKATEQNAYESYRDVQKKYDSEMASELDVLQAEVNWQINIPETTKSARNRDLAMSNLKHLAGLDPEKLLVLTDSLNEIPAKNDVENLSIILNNRPDYLVQQGLVDLKDINISAERAKFFPTLSASAQIGTSFANDEFILEDGTEFFKFGLSVTLPIYHGGSRFANMEKARLEKEQSLIDLVKKREDISIEINNLNLLLDEASSRIISAETTVKTAERAYGIMEISFKNGMATQLDQKDARLNLSGAKLNYYSAIFDYLNAFFQWQQATGKGDKLPF